MSDFERLVELYLNDFPATEEEEMVVKTTIRVTPRSNRNHRKVNAQHKDAIRKRLERNGINTEDISNPEKLWKKLSSASHNNRQYEAGRITAGKTRSAREKRQELIAGEDISMSEAFNNAEMVRENYSLTHDILQERARYLRECKKNLKKEIENIQRELDNVEDELATLQVKLILRDENTPILVYSSK